MITQDAWTEPSMYGVSETVYYRNGAVIATARTYNISCEGVGVEVIYINGLKLHSKIAYPSVVYAQNMADNAIRL